jgi:hypothetical protein
MRARRPQPHISMHMGGCIIYARAAAAAAAHVHCVRSSHRRVYTAGPRARAVHCDRGESKSARPRCIHAYIYIYIYTYNVNAYVNHDIVYVYIHICIYMYIMQAGTRAPA